MSLLPGFPNIWASSPWKPSPSWIWTLRACGNETGAAEDRVCAVEQSSVQRYRRAPAGALPELRPKFHFRCRCVNWGVPPHGRRGVGSSQDEAESSSSFLPSVSSLCQVCFAPFGRARLMAKVVLLRGSFLTTDTFPALL